MRSLTGKVAWVTGAGTGIGEAAAVALAKEGMTVVLTGRRAAMLEAVAERINAAGPGTALVRAADLTKSEAVEAVADALKGVDIPVMVKNPVNPDLELWIGALERLNRAGIRTMAAIHRGLHFQQIDRRGIEFRRNSQSSSWRQQSLAFFVRRKAPFCHQLFLATSRAKIQRRCGQTAG